MSQLISELISCSSLLPDHEDTLWSPRSHGGPQILDKVSKKISNKKKMLFSDIQKKFSRNRVLCDTNVKQIFAFMMNQRRCVAVEDSWTLDTLISTLEVAFTELPDSYYITIDSKPIRPNISLKEYGLKEGSTIMINECLLGGQDYLDRQRFCCDKRQILIPTYSHILECEIMLMSEYSIQSADIPDIDANTYNFNLMFQHVSKHADGILSILEQDWLLEQLENISLTIRYASKCNCFDDYLCLFQLGYRLFTGKTFSVLVRDKIEQLFKAEVQASDMGDVLNTLRKAFDFTSEIQETPLVKKLVSLFSFALTQGFLKRFGLELSDEDYSKMEQRAMLNAFSSKKAFFFCVLDTTLYICEKTYEWKQTGDISSFIHSSSEYTIWMKEADRILNLAPFVGNLEAHNTSYFTYLSDLRDVIEKGEAYAKYTRTTAGVDSRVIKSKLNSLQLLQNTEITRRAAQQERIQPMGVLVYGSSSIAKSAFTKILYNYYGSLFDLDRDDHYRYVRNPMDEYWSNFDSSKWCIQLDDIAFKNPAKSTDIDSTLQDLLNVVNNVPYVPPQAALEDKGRTPVMAKLVIATTNCVSLNAQEYFWCPLAVRRRLPFVVTVKPKKEFLHSNQTFIDPSKLTCEDGKFPDFWEILVSTIKPTFQSGREHASLEEVARFSDINKFLQFFGKACLLHEQNQKKAMSKDNDVLNVEICKKCLAPLPHNECIELQFGDTQLSLIHNVYNLNIFTRFFVWLIDCVIEYKKMMFIMDLMARYRVTKYVACSIMNNITNQELSVQFFGRFGERMQHPQIKRLLFCGTLLTGALTMFYFYNKNSKVEEPKQEEKSVEEEVEIQGNTYGTTEDQLLKEEQNNVWYNPTVELTTFDVPKASSSLAGATPDEVRDLFDRNCVLLKIKVNGENITRTMRGVFVKGHMCLTNGHAFKEHGEQFTVTIYQKSALSTLSSNLSMQISRKDISFSKNNDVCIFEVSSLPPFKDISKFWNNKEIFPSSGIELTREIDGTMTKHNLYALKYMPNMPVPEMNNQYDIFFGVSSDKTEVGHCGSLCIAITPRGPIVFGIHFLGKDNSIGVLKVDLHEINVLLQNPCLNQRPIVQGGTAPMLDCSTKHNALTEPHFKSLFRYLENGTLNMYGSFAGFRPRPRSSVCATPLQKEFLEHYKTEVNYGKPCMSGWAPWRKNIVEMVKPNVNYDKTILSECVTAFTEDILAGLPNEWEKELVVLSNKAAVNGLPGVMYIDKIASNTSMGFPWCCTKKAFLHDDRCETYPNGIDFTPEVWERVEKIENLYNEGFRAFPVFTGHLKDEATPLKKCEIKKTRMFTGAPIDWSLVVRKRLLSFVRLLQKNKFVFEAGPGTVAQSAEWGLIRDYLTTFGSDRIVAGDYGKFDKRMLADFILAAFDIIMRVHKAAGFSDEECRIIMCIGEDTAFPLTNVNGDLVEFFGTNPSGHPLTVVINSLVNSLYMRYCYRKLNPLNEVKTFKQNVHLFTYGDDNIMGVSELSPWFNHTAIQAQLAEIGVEYTMADKESESVPFVHLDDVSFLKRKWKWNPDVNNWVCPLEEESIIKSLTMWVPSKTIDCYHQMTAVISSANSEYFFHGREKFEEKRKFFVELLNKEPYIFYVNESTLPTYDQLVERFNKASEALQK